MRNMYEFKIEDLDRFALENGFKIKHYGSEIVFDRCPYCQKKTENMNSRKFSVNVKTGQFNCFRASCGAKGNMLTLAKDFNFSLGREADDYYNIGPKRHYRSFKKIEPIEPKDAAIEYMKSRGIQEDIVKKYQITATEDGNIVFPFVDENNELQFIKYRNPKPKTGQNKEWCEKNCKPILFGMAQCDPNNKTLIVTEGQIDSLSVAQAGFVNAVSVPTGANGFTWVPYCWNWIQNFDKIIIFGDHENGYITLFNEFADRFKYKVWHVREEDYQDCKDANEILKKYGAEQIKKCIENAEQLPILKAIDLSKVEYVNPYEIEKLPTGINNVDDLLCGGLPFGQVILLTGKAGDGKSTFASQLMLSAINNNYKCFAYSGELPNYMFRSWIDFQAAGNSRSNFTDQWTKWTYEKPKVVKAKVLDKISEWYKDQIWLYDNSDFNSDEDESLTVLLEQIINQYGVRVILIDNLMTALDLEKGLGTDKYERQSLFIKKMTRLALQYDVLIILVAHKRKDTGYNEVNESVSGSLDIINLASIVLSYERPNKFMLEEGTATNEDRVLKITKNRLFGKIDTWGYVLHYDPISKRIYLNEYEQFRKYGWVEKNEKVTIEPAPF